LLISPSEAAIEKRELLEEKGMDQTVEFLRQRAIEVRVVFLVWIAEEVEVSEHQPRAGDQREEINHVLGKLVGKSVISGGVYISDCEGEISCGRRECGGEGELTLDSGREGNDVWVPSGDQAAPTPVGVFGGDPRERRREERALLERVEGGELGFLNAKDGGGSSGNGIVHDGALVWITEPLNIPRFKTQRLNRHAIH
jgi:hypothetical protein